MSRARIICFRRRTSFPSNFPAASRSLSSAPRGNNGVVLGAAPDLIPVVIARDLDVLFCGINPGLLSDKLRQHFARPGNRFWPTIHRAGFTPRQLAPAEQRELLRYGCGITNLVARATASADELTREELVAGARILARKVRKYAPRYLAVVGIGAYRAAFAA